MGQSGTGSSFLRDNIPFPQPQYAGKSSGNPMPASKSTREKHGLRFWAPGRWTRRKDPQPHSTCTLYRALRAKLKRTSPSGLVLDCSWPPTQANGLILLRVEEPAFLEHVSAEFWLSTLGRWSVLVEKAVPFHWQQQELEPPDLSTLPKSSFRPHNSMDCAQNVL